MPPSGFDINETRQLKDFFTSCLNKLIRENRDVRSPRAAVVREIDHIDTDYDTVERSTTAGAVLQLMRGFYSRLAEKMPENEPDFNVLRHRALDTMLEIEAEVLAIKIVEKGAVAEPS